MIDFENKRARLKEIIDKNNICFFWDGFRFFVEDAGYEEESAFAECIFYFGEDSMFNEIVNIKCFQEFKGFRLELYHNVNYHESQKNFMDYCFKNNFDILKFGVDVKIINVSIKSQAVMGYVRLKFMEIKGMEFPPITNHINPDLIGMETPASQLPQSDISQLMRNNRDDRYRAY